MKNKFLILLLLGLFSVLGANYAVAEGEASLAENAALLVEGIAAIEEGIVHAQQGHAKETSDSIHSSIEAMKPIASVTLDRTLGKAKERMRLAQYMCKRFVKGKPKDTDSMEKVVELLEKAKGLLEHAQTLKP